MKIERLIVLALVLSSGLQAQTTPQALLITRIYGIVSGWSAKECGTNGLINTSQYTRQNNYHSVYATGTGSWTVAINYSDTSCTGSWTSFGPASQITQASSPAIAVAVGYHPYIQIAVTGNAVVTYSAVKDFFVGAAGGGVTASGSVCTITAIVQGIITAATCAP